MIPSGRSSKRGNKAEPVKKKMKQCCQAGVAIAALAFFAMTATPVWAQDDAAGKADDLAAAVAEAAKTEAENLENLRNQLAQARQYQKSAVDQINAYKIQGAIFSNQLIAPETPIKELEKFWLEIQGVPRTLSERIKEFKARKTSVEPLLSQTQDQVALTEKQIAEIPGEAASEPKLSIIRGQLKGLLASLLKKQKILVELNGVYTEMSDGSVNIRQEFYDLSGRYNETIQKRRKKELLERQTSLVSVGLKQIIEEIKEVPSHLQSVAGPAFWAEQLGFIRTGGGFYFVAFVTLFLMIQGFIFQTRRYLARLKDHSELKEHFWSRLTISIVQKSVFLLGSTLFFYFYAEFGPFPSKPPIVRAGLNLLLVWLFSAGCMDALRLYCGDEAVPVPKKPVVYLRLLITLVRWFGVTYILLSWLGAGATVIIVWRLIFEISLYVWTFFFWNCVQKSRAAESPEGARNLPPVLLFFKLLSFVIVFTPLILELSGYGSLAIYWLASWGRTAVVALWSLLVFLILREWNPKVEKAAESAAETAAMPKNSIRWVVVQFSTLVWFGGVVIFLVLAWGGKQAVFLGIYQFLQNTYQVGTMSFSLLGFIIAILILLLTQAVARPCV